MKKILAIFLASMMLLSLVACGTNATPSEEGGGGGGNDERNWMADYGMSNLVIPEGATISDSLSYGNPKRDIKRDTAFTEAEVASFAQSVLESCNAPYTTKYDADKDEYVRIELTNAEDAKRLDEYSWKYEEDGKIYDIRIYFGIETTIGFEKYQSS